MAAAGYKGEHYTVANQVLRRPAVQAAIHNAVWSRIKTAAPLALSNIIKLAESAKSETVRLKANETIMSLAGFVPPKASEAEDSASKPLTDMTPDELRDFIIKGREQLAQAREQIDAKLVDVTPKPDNAALDAALDPYVSAMFD